VYLTPPLKGFPLELDIGARSRKIFVLRLPEGRKSFKIGLVVFDTIPAVMTDSHPASQPRCSSKYALCISASLSKNQNDGTEKKFDEKSLMISLAVSINYTNMTERRKLVPRYAWRQAVKITLSDY